MSDGRPLGSSYLLRQRLGSGASGEVWSGVDRSGAAYAFKLLRSELTSDAEVVRRFVQEREVLSGIDHPNVVRVRDLVVEGQTLAIVMDLVTGRDLRAVLRERGSLEPTLVAGWGAGIAAGLQAAHRRGVVHRDIKPENVLIDETIDPPLPRLTDFGVARLLQESRQSTMMLGTPQYMAPETVSGTPPTAATDIYSLGIMLYELSCGVQPFADRGHTMAVLRAHALDVPGRPDGLSDPLWALIERMVAKDPADRPASAQEVADALTAMTPELAGLPAAPMLSHPPAAATSGGFESSPNLVPAESVRSARTPAPGPGDTVFSPHHLSGQPGLPEKPDLSWPSQPTPENAVEAPTMYGAPSAAGPPYTPGYGGVPAGYGSVPNGQYVGGYPPPGYPHGYGSHGQTEYGAPPGHPSYAQAGATSQRRRTPWLPVAIMLPLLALVGVLAWVLLKPKDPEPETTTASGGAQTSLAATSSPASAIAVPPPVSTPTAFPDVVASAGSVECTRDGSGPFAAAAVPDPGVTTCAFAKNVRLAYAQSGYNGAAGTVKAWSPAVRKTFTMSCRPKGGVIICEGGINAQVMIYGGRLLGS